MPPFQLDPSSPAPIWICPICQKLMRTRTIEVTDGEESFAPNGGLVKIPRKVSLRPK